ncbi:MAG: DNA polymerase III subunit alpha, partial [Chlorobiales bacterium]|nr:DNA polymerase III subunit alpha [Chlorobiales bacterium]
EGKRLHKIIGVVVETKKHFDKKNKVMLFGIIEDFFGKADFTVFHSVYEKFEQYLKKDAIVMLIAEAESKEGQIKLLVNEVVPIESVRERFINRVILRLDAADGSSIDKATEVKRICENNRGGVPLDFEVAIDENGKPQVLRLFARNILIDADDKVLEEIERVVGQESVRIGA